MSENPFRFWSTPVNEGQQHDNIIYDVGWNEGCDVGWNEGYNAALDAALIVLRGRSREWVQKKVEALRKAAAE